MTQGKLVEVSEFEIMREEYADMLRSVTTPLGKIIFVLPVLIASAVCKGILAGVREMIHVMNEGMK